MDLHYGTACSRTDTRACLCFGRYRFEPQTARLWADEREIKITRKAAAVLGLLVACAGRPVTKAELFASVWSDRVVSDDALTTCIQELRKALGDDPRKPRYIETRHGSGYQFIAALSRAAGSAASAPGVAALAVLPFADMSAARDSCFHFRRPGLDVQQVGRQLGVEALLVGSVRKDGERLRITVQLIEVASGYHKWSHRFERTLGDVFAIQDEIAQTVATILCAGALRGRERFGDARYRPAAFELILGDDAPGVAATELQESTSTTGVG